MIGKTNVPAFGLGSHTVNKVYGATRNPSRPDAERGRILRRGSSRAGAEDAAGGRRVGHDGQSAQPGRMEQRLRFRPTAGLGRARRGDSVFQHRLSNRRADGARRGGSGALACGAVGRGLPAGRARRRGGRGSAGWAIGAGLIRWRRASLPRRRRRWPRWKGLGWTVEPVAPPFPAAALWEAWVSVAPVRRGDEPRHPLARRVSAGDVADAGALRESATSFARKWGPKCNGRPRRARPWLVAAREIFARYDAVGAALDAGLALHGGASRWARADRRTWRWTPITGWMEVVGACKPSAACPCWGCRGISARRGCLRGLQVIGAPGADAHDPGAGARLSRGHRLAGSETPARACTAARVRLTARPSPSDCAIFAPGQWRPGRCAGGRQV